MSAFERVVKSVVQELDRPGELVPVDSLWSSTSFQPYCLLARRSPGSRFWRPRYKGINLSIRDILEPDDPEPGTEGGPGGGACGPGPGCPPTHSPTWASSSVTPEGSSFSKVRFPGGQVGMAGGPSAPVSFQTSAAAVPSNSKTRWMGSCGAAWS